MPKKTQRPLFPAGESRRLGLLMDKAATQRTVAAWEKEDTEKLLLLCRNYGIQRGPSMFYELALALARELYPEPKKPGRRSKWTVLNQGALVVEIERLVKPRDTAHGVSWAAGQLANQEPWKSFLETKESDTTSPDPKEALRRVYYAFKEDKWAKVMRKAFKWHDHQGTIADWEKEVADFLRNPHPK
jgi:hypothetical protein